MFDLSDKTKKAPFPKVAQNHDLCLFLNSLFIYEEKYKTWHPLPVGKLSIEDLNILNEYISNDYQKYLDRNESYEELAEFMRITLPQNLSEEVRTLLLDFIPNLGLENSLKSSLL